ncbi:hypothetical protein QFC24_002525 [Naganishia onofrii]|uniref:Uncharacterized protein n=1 Tax=Naganishia onofrii TaxID=1851511 RepID=A0ACC2XRW0_9TREE|nr:hypothetical protein QFC24_002525 [Naganishia onofrii]
MPERDKEIAPSGGHNSHEEAPVGSTRKSALPLTKGKKQDRSPFFKPSSFRVHTGRIRKKKPSTFLNPDFERLLESQEMTEEARWDGFDANGFFGKGSSDAKYQPTDYLWVYKVPGERLSDEPSTVPDVSDTQV